jgi:hypothetical protein
MYVDDLQVYEQKVGIAVNISTLYLTLRPKDWHNSNG